MNVLQMDVCFLLIQNNRLQIDIFDERVQLCIEIDSFLIANWLLLFFDCQSYKLEESLNLHRSHPLSTIYHWRPDLLILNRSNWSYLEPTMFGDKVLNGSESSSHNGRHIVVIG